ncbi:hypothetical protein NA57DRAFT_43004 [Rhizodiscina lignyota]|uniref:Protein transport protein SEC31 n=1 Tax=Rhizodiscina lignyota TaxID=1504668 RepID=A0A9P4IE16_9PEZI|nr:hypothetical protein NA57DRAFT_43004 [Rhizodiscina lignyota]
MVRLREIPRTATFAWSTGAAPPLLATGTRAGAVDADFSNETQLELWDLDLGNASQAGELKPVGNISIDSRFHDLAWSEPSDEHPRGIVAGALESGAVDLWDAEKLGSDSSNSHFSRLSKHSGAAKALQFNPFRPELLASSGAKGELYITDLNNVASPFRLGTSAARADDFDALDWNKKVPHILVTGSSGGFVTVWDVKAKKESLTLNNQGRKAVSAVAWDPDIPTRLVTAIPNDQDPLILMWDLRNSNAPEKILRGHDQGVLSLSWCQQDSDLLLSCGKDNRTICWNPHTGQALGEFPVVTNWTFQTRWNPHNPNFLATASFDGKISVQTIQNTNPEASKADSSAAAQSLDGEDFFAKAQVQPQGATFTLPQAPKWLERPTGVSFGFGGKVVKFGLEKDSRKSKISISTFAVDSSVGSASEHFEEALQKGDLAAICENKIADAKTEEEKADWRVIETLMSDQPRKKLMEYLGISNEDAAANGEVVGDSTAQTNGAKDSGSFFDNAGTSDNFLSDLASSKGAKTNNPFQIFTGSESEADQNITRALMLGSFDKALDICLKEDRMSDAFMIAICGGQKCIDKAQAAYFKRKGDGPNYLRLLASVVGKNLWDFVYNADLKNWKEVMATLCTFADESEFSDLCEALGDRLEELVQEGSEKSTDRKDATFCYLAGSKLEKVVGNWAQELEEDENAGVEAEEGDSSFSIHARSLQNFIEKVTIFRQATNFKDSEQQLTSDWKLAPLYAKYTEYADVAASHGQLQIAEKYLDLLPVQYPAAEVARNRVKQATRKTAPQVAQRQPALTGVGAQRSQRVVPAYHSIQTPSVPTPASATASASPYAPAGIPAPTQPATSPYAPAGASPYAPSGYQPTQQGYQPPGVGIPQPQYGVGYQQPQQGLPPPPRAFSSSPAVPPPSKVSNLTAWNDTPDFGSKPASRRGTPGLGGAAITSPFPNAQPSPQPGPPVAAPYSIQQRATPPLAPPPRGPPRVTSPPTAGSPLSTPTSAANVYAPQHTQAFQPNAPPPTIPRGTSPYNPPPSTGPPTNRYAPAPGSQPTPFQPPSLMGPPSRQVAPPPNPYSMQPPSAYNPIASPPAQTMSQGPPPSTMQGPPRAGPPQGPPQGPPKNSPLTLTDVASGDRSHIGPDAQPVFEMFNAEMQRVKGRAPAAFKAQVMDTEKRLNILFDQLNEGDVLKPETMRDLSDIADKFRGRDWDTASQVLTALMQGGTEPSGTVWLVGVKRLLAMGKATPN